LIVKQRKRYPATWLLFYSTGISHNNPYKVG
jgi:hypothetical protein